MNLFAFLPRWSLLRGIRQHCLAIRQQQGHVLLRPELLLYLVFVDTVSSHRLHCVQLLHTRSLQWFCVAKGVEWQLLNSSDWHALSTHVRISTLLVCQVSRRSSHPRADTVCFTWAVERLHLLILALHHLVLLFCLLFDFVLQLQYFRKFEFLPRSYVHVYFF